MPCKLKLLSITTLFVYSFILCNCVYATVPDPYKITGRIINTLNVPIPFAPACLLHPENDSLLIAAISDTSGYFSIPYSKPGNYNLRISSFTFKPKTVKIELIPGNVEIALGDIQLMNDIFYLDEVFVTGEQNKLDYRVDKIIFTPDSMSLAKSVTGADLLNYIPGVTVSHIDQSIRVKGNENVLVLVDGRTSDRELSTIHASEIKQIEIISNPSTRYSSDIDNIVNIILKEEKNKGIQIVTNLETTYKNALFFGTLALDYKNKKSRFFVKYNLSAQNMTNADSSIRIESYDDAEIRYNTYPVKDQFFGALFHSIYYGMDYSVNQKNFFNITCKYFHQDAEEEMLDGVKSFTNDTFSTQYFYKSLSHSIVSNHNYSFFYKRSFTNPNHEIWLSSSTFLLNRTNTDDYSSGETEDWNNYSEAWNEETRNRQQSNDTRLE